MICETSDPILEQLFIEVDHDTQSFIRQPQICHNLLEMDASQRINRFDLNDDFPFDD